MSRKHFMETTINGAVVKFGILHGRVWVTVVPSSRDDSSCSLDHGLRTVRAALALLPYELWPAFARSLVPASMLGQDKLPVATVATVE